MQENTLVFSIFLIFSGSALLATVALWARQSLLAAYIIIGIILGPWGLKWVTDAYVIHQVSDVGIVFLLFLLGLHLEPKRLWLMLKNVISIGVLSSFLFFSIGFLLAKLWGGYSFSECMIIGAAMMFSSTIIGLKMMPPTALHHHPVGEMMIGLLLFQDLLAILLLLILNIAGLGTFHMQDVTMISIGFPVIIILAFLLEQWFLMPFDEESLTKLSQAIKKMEPVLKEMGQLNRKFPVKAAYLGEQTRALSLLLDIAAAKLLPLPKMMESDNKEAFSILAQQFDKLDNTRLGYRIDRKREALMILTYKMQIKDPQKRFGIYFHFLKDRYVGADGEIRLKVSDEEDLKKFIEEKRVQITRMMKSKNFTEIERQGAEKLLGVVPTGQSPVAIPE